MNLFTGINLLNFDRLLNLKHIYLKINNNNHNLIYIYKINYNSIIHGIENLTSNIIWFVEYIT